MTSLLFLSAEDFHIQQGSKGPIMCHEIPGLSLVMFYSTHCTHCQTLIPIFKKLPGTINGCQFAILNVSLNRRCVEMSRETIAPLKYVPYIVLYVRGRPFMAYKGPQNPDTILQFVVEVANHLRAKQEFSRGTVKHDPKKRAIPEYCTGVPIKGSGKDEEVCYLEFDEAYEKVAQ